MSDWLMKVIRAEAERLLELAAEDDELRADLRALAEQILAATVPQPAPVESVEETPAFGQEVPTEAESTSEPLHQLTLGRSLPNRGEIHRDRSSSEPEVRHDDLLDLESRCRRKSEAARRAAERLRRAREENDTPIENSPDDPEMVAWGERLVNSFYWSLSSEGSATLDVSVVDHAGGCFEAVAEALALVRVTQQEHPGSTKSLDRVLPLVAEAQSALRAAVQRLGDAGDSDQLEVFEWLKAAAAQNHVYIKSFMRADEVAEPSRWSELLARIESVAGGSGKPLRLLDSQIGPLRDHVKRIQECADNDSEWYVLIDVVNEIVAGGIPPSNRELRDLLLPVIDEVPARDEYPENFRRVLREIDRFLATRDATARSSLSHEPSAEVRETARLLASKSIVLIGGNRRREAQESLKRALGLKDLIWIETKEHQAVDTFEPLIAREDVALVLLAIRWSSHAFGDVKQLCDRHGKLLVRLPGGYNPNQVAAQILSQSSGQLSSELGREAARARPPAQPERGPEPE
jgi:hypothetical protein